MELFECEEFDDHVDDTEDLNGRREKDDNVQLSLFLDESSDSEDAAVPS